MARNTPVENFLKKKFWEFFDFFCKILGIFDQIDRFFEGGHFCPIFVSKYPYLISRKYESKMQTRIDFRLFLLWKSYNHHFGGNYLYFSPKSFGRLKCSFCTFFCAWKVKILHFQALWGTQNAKDFIYWSIFKCLKMTSRCRKLTKNTFSGF